MDEQTQAQFVQWLAQQLGVSTEEELQAAVQELGEDGIQQAFQQFQQEAQAQAFRQGGKLEYMKRLQAFRKGGKAKKACLEEGKQHDRTARGITKFSKKKDGASANTPDNRKGENKLKWTTARAH